MGDTSFVWFFKTACAMVFVWAEQISILGVDNDIWRASSKGVASREHVE